MATSREPHDSYRRFHPAQPEGTAMTALRLHHRVLPADPDDLDTITDLLATSLASGPVATWLIPDDAARLRVHRWYVGLHVAHAATYGEILTTDPVNGAVLWFPSGADGIPGYHDVLADACGEHSVRFAALDDLITRSRPATPHHVLAFLAVAPDQWRRGVGTALLTDLLHRIDRQNGAVALVARCPRSRALFGRYGFTRHGGAITLPNGPMLWPMRRPSADIDRPGGPGAA